MAGCAFSDVCLRVSRARDMQQAREGSAFSDVCLRVSFVSIEVI